MKAFVFPGQGAQFVGMGKDLYDNNPLAKELFEKANDILGFRITDIMFSGTDEELKQTKVTPRRIPPFCHFSFVYGRRCRSGHGGRPFFRRILRVGSSRCPEL